MDGIYSCFGKCVKEVRQDALAHYGIGETGSVFL